MKQESDPRRRDNQTCERRTARTNTHVDAELLRAQEGLLPAM